MEKGNVLVIGNSGVGKSTLINSVLGEDRAKTGFGTSGSTGELKIYQNDVVPFRLIDTVGFEPSWLKSRMAIKAVEKWSKKSVKEGNKDTQINVIWFCIEGTSSKLFPETINNLSKATKMWPSIPVIVVITKSYSVPDRIKNTEMVHNAFAKQNRNSINLKKVIPVVAETFTINENAYAAPEGITDLLEATNELLPEGMKAAKIDIAQFILDRKRVFAHSIVGVVTAGAVVVGAVSLPFSDGLILGPTETGLIYGLSQIYGIKKDEKSKDFFDSIINVGTASIAAKTAISAIKAIPGINIGAAVLNAIIAGSIVAALGEGSIYAFEQVYLGKKTVEDIEWVKNLLNSRLSNQFIDKVMEVIKNLSDKSDKDSIIKAILDLFSSSKK